MLHVVNLKFSFLPYIEKKKTFRQCHVTSVVNLLLHALYVPLPLQLSLIYFIQPDTPQILTDTEGKDTARIYRPSTFYLHVSDGTAKL